MDDGVLSEPGARLSGIVAELGSVGTERSFKLGPGRLIVGRVLYGIDKTRLPFRELLTQTERLGLPAVYRRVLPRWYEAANFLYVGVEEGPVEACYKLYLEFPVFIGIAPGAQGQGGRPALMYLGFKWDATHGTPLAVTHYVWRVHLPLAAIHTALVGIGAAGAGIAAGCAQTLLDRCAGLVHEHDLVLLQVAERGKPRRSLDLNLYAAEIAVGAVADPIRLAAERYGVEPEPIHRLLDAAAACPLGHVGAGLDRRGEEFLTIYYEHNTE